MRLPKGGLSLRLGFYDQARALSREYQDLMRSKLGENTVLLSPATEAIPTADLLAGRAGARLDGHDRITMPKNRIPEWGQMTFPAPGRPEVGISLSGALPDLMHFTGEAQLLGRRWRDSSHQAQVPAAAPWFRPPMILEELQPRAPRLELLRTGTGRYEERMDVVRDEAAQ